MSISFIKVFEGVFHVWLTQIIENLQYLPFYNIINLNSESRRNIKKV